jgi:hypothetical protein
MNEITITLTGLAASEYMTKEPKLVKEASAILEENSNLQLKILELETYIATMKNGVPDYFMKDTPDLRLKRDSELMKDSQYEKKSPFKRPVKPEVTIIDDTIEPTLDDTWKAFVNAGEPAINAPKTHWSETDSAVIENAIDKTDIKYYSVGALARFLNRSISAVRTRAITNYGAHIRNGMIVSEV